MNTIQENTNLNGVNIHTQNPSRPQLCRNCGQNGHVHRDCPHPITSFGIICYRIKPNNSIEYLMIQRKDSLSFMEFIRGKYEIHQDDYIKMLLSGMTINERKMLLIKPFDYLWNYVWYQNSAPKQTSEFNIAKNKFDNLKPKLSQLLQNSISHFVDPEWGFPKGRRKIKEEDVDCAVREFNEETGINPTSINLEKLSPFEEIFYGTNKVLYRHVYYIASLPYSSNKLHINPKNYNQIREVRDISWLSFKECLNKIRDHNHERKKLFTEVHKKITSLYSNATNNISITLNTSNNNNE